MLTVWKVLVALALTAPLGAYVAGSLAATASDDPRPRETIEIREPVSRPTGPERPRAERSPDPAPSREGRQPEDRVDEDDDDVEVITPDYEDLDDDQDQDQDQDRDRDRDRDDDHDDDHHEDHDEQGEDD